jgi:CO/xanthine dehydrogenase Mo-binding subunit
MDPFEFRFKNAYRNNQISASGKLIDDAYIIETMKEAAALAGIKLPAHLLSMSSQG